MPDFEFERRLGDRVAGIDEVGRAPLAGPVFAAAVILDADRLPASLAARIDDSKKLTREIRTALFDEISPYAEIGIGSATAEEIDRVNILRASFLAMERAVAALPSPPLSALVDGKTLPTLQCRAEAVVGGDGRCLSIAAASIIAKVTRDRLMGELALEYPGYGWERNVGYGTPEHRMALRQLGVTPLHRRSFAYVAECCK